MVHVGRVAECIGTTRTDLSGLKLPKAATHCLTLISEAKSMAPSCAVAANRNMTTPVPTSCSSEAAQSVLTALAASATARGTFATVESLSDRIRCHAKDCPEPAWYEVQATDRGWIVRFATPDRWLSESIESDLMHFGDPIEELVEEELAELGWRGKVPVIRHFRDDAKLYTFENVVSVDGATPSTELIAKFLFAYEAAFRALGDVGGGDEE